MKSRFITKPVIGICLFLSLFCLATVVQAATEMWSHGNVAEIENPGNCSYKYFGWGLDITQKPGMANWIHLTVPSPYGAGQLGASQIRLKLYTGSADAFVDRIDVYNGNAKIKSITVNYSNGWKDVTVNLGGKYSFNRGLGISLHIGAGVESMSHRFIFSSAGAYFY